MKTNYEKTFISYSIDKITYPEDVDIVNAFNNSEKEFLKSRKKNIKNSNLNNEND